MNENQQQPKSDTAARLKDSVLTRIKEENVQPTGRWYFFCSNLAIWLLWLLTIVIGGIALAEALYVSMHAGFETFEMTHGSLFTFIIDSLPWLWLAAFLLMALLAYRNLRMTRHGYKYPFSWIVGTSILLSFVAGGLFYEAGVSRALDLMLGRTMPVYLSVSSRQEHLWDDPEAGRISGIFVGYTEDPHQALFVDAANREWVAAIHELPPKELTLFVSGNRVRVVGEASTAPMRSLFYVCGVLPWMPKDGHSLDSLRQARESVKEMERKFEPFFDVDAAERPESHPSLRCREIMDDVLNRQEDIVDEQR